MVLHRHSRCARENPSFDDRVAPTFSRDYMVTRDPAPHGRLRLYGATVMAVDRAVDVNVNGRVY